jgi:TonB family protein
VVSFEFVDGTELKLKNIFESQCDPSMTFGFSDSLRNLDVLEVFKTKALASVKLPKGKSAKIPGGKHGSSDNANSEVLRANIACLAGYIAADPPPVPLQYQTKASVPLSAGDEPIYTIVDELPEFEGGIEAMNTFIKTNLRYPLEARRMGEEGTVYVQFVVNKDGVLENVHTIRGASKSLDAESERIINIMPRWKPGRLQGQPVYVRFVLPIRFKLDNGKKPTKK